MPIPQAVSTASLRLRHAAACAFLAFVGAGVLQAKTYVVTANPDMTFTPDPLIIYQHDQVTFENAGGSGTLYTHNVHADNNSFICGDDCSLHSGPSSNPWQHTITFNALGMIDYYCDAHASFDPMSGVCSGMCASIIVIDRIFVNGFEQVAP